MVLASLATVVANTAIDYCSYASLSGASLNTLPSMSREYISWIFSAVATSMSSVSEFVHAKIARVPSESRCNYENWRKAASFS